MIPAFLQSLERDRELGARVHYHRVLPEREAAYADLSPPLPDAVGRHLPVFGIERLYSHQVQAIQAIRDGWNVVVVTPTASGKTLTYVLPVLESLLNDADASALLLFPLKALEQDQRGKIEQWQARLAEDFPLSVEIYDGDTPRTTRSRIKHHLPHFLISNPDMLHQGILAFHPGWEKLFKRLKWVVIDELHAYRGVFGSHILQVLRRLSRLLAYHGVHPQFICLSATIANPLELAEKLTGRECVLIDQSGAPAGRRHLVFMAPEASTTSAVSRLFVRALDAGLKTIVFSKSRVTTEVVHRIVLETRADLASRISSYRAGFLPEERRDIERRLAAGEIQGVVSTSALELGIDIGGLDACILAGYPGSVMSLWQRAGRVGRRGDDSVVFLVAGTDALDQYFLANPQALLERSFEAALINETNEEVLRGHLPAAAAEIPLMKGDPFIDVDRHGPMIAELEREGALLRSASGEQWFPGRHRPHAQVNLRNVGGTFGIFREGERRPMGEISGSAVFRECHEGAIYLHCGEQYLVTDLDLESERVTVRPTSATIYTMVRSDKQTEILDDRESKDVCGFRAHVGKVKVTETYHSYERRRIYTQELLSVEPLDFPPQSWITNSVWIELPPGLGDILASDELHFMGGIHAVEHAAISLIPLFALCDRNDVGGISFTRHPQLDGGAIFFYDGYPGGAGIAERVYTVIQELLEKALGLITACSCEEGCPSCIQSPKCGAGNKPLDKRAALRVLRRLLNEPMESPSGVMPVKGIPAVREDTDVPWEPQAIPEDKRVVVMDLETQLSADEVGGWSEARLMRLAVGAVWDSEVGAVFTYDEAHVADLIDLLKQADLVVGFNVRRFDYEVLRGYTFENLQHLHTLDLLERITTALGKRLKLDTLAAATLGTPKSADGLQSLAWFREGRMDLVREYCIHDVEITRDLFLFALQHGYLIYDRKDMGPVRVPLRINLKAVLDQAQVSAA